MAERNPDEVRVGPAHLVIEVRSKRQLETPLELAQPIGLERAELRPADARQRVHEDLGVAELLGQLDSPGPHSTAASATSQFMYRCARLPYAIASSRPGGS